jgi:hypothetical protein
LANGSKRRGRGTEMVGARWPGRPARSAGIRDLVCVTFLLKSEPHCSVQEAFRRD